MKYTVLWKPSAEQRLAQIWLAAVDRRAITAASHRVDRQLANDPDQKGEPRPKGRRMLLEHPLGVVFKVEPDDRTVYVLTVWHV